MMKTVNALSVRNRLGEILDGLERTGEPILISKGKKIRAVLITPEVFERRFLDFQVREEKERFLDRLKAMKGPKVIPEDSVETLRRLRGYDG
jgi:PHD/YefM family antitoxin component YafN of YafNO toxin-antitoxin module